LTHPTSPSCQATTRSTSFEAPSLFTLRHSFDADFIDDDCFSGENFTLGSCAESSSGAGHPIKTPGSGPEPQSPGSELSSSLGACRSLEPPGPGLESSLVAGLGLKSPGPGIESLSGASCGLKTPSPGPKSSGYGSNPPMPNTYSGKGNLTERNEAKHSRSKLVDIGTK
jgi:hypothetical protein